MFARMSHRVFPVIRSAHAGYALCDSPEDTSIDNTPNGTYSICKRQSRGQKLVAYMPSAFLVSISMTYFLSSAFHLRIVGSLLTTDLIYFSMSSICPLSS